MVLYVYITHQKNINNCYKRIKDNVKTDFIIVQGGYTYDYFDKETNVLYLNCNDTYLGLPEKVIKTFHYIISHEYFNKYTHFVKLDDDMTVIKKFDKLDDDYIGKVQNGEGNRKWHFGKTNTFWDTLPYPGEYKPWCLGGFGYAVSRKALEKILPNHGYLEHIYEDVMMGVLMNSIGVKPVIIKTKDYMISPDH